MGTFRSPCLVVPAGTCSTTWSLADTPSLSRCDLAQRGRHDVDPTAESAYREFSGGHEAIGSGSADAQQLCSAGDCKQQGQTIEHVVFQFCSPPSEGLCGTVPARPASRRCLRLLPRNRLRPSRVWSPRLAEAPKTTVILAGDNFVQNLGAQCRSGFRSSTRPYFVCSRWSLRDTQTLKSHVSSTANMYSTACSCFLTSQIRCPRYPYLDSSHESSLPGFTQHLHSRVAPQCE